MATKIKTLPRLIIAGLAAGGLFLGFRCAVEHGLISPPGFTKSEVPKVAVLPEVRTAPSSVAAAIPSAPLPGKQVASAKGPGIRMQVMAWNAQMGLMFANGGPRTVDGSLMNKRGVNLSLIREDDCNKMQASLVAFAKSLKSNPQPSEGAHFVIVMGDGTAAFLAGLNSELTKLGKEYQAEVIGAVGFSRGEDKFMGPAEWKTNPKAARGGLVAGVIRDGDWNIAMKWAADNGIKNNPSETSWDEEALNWVNASDFVDAGTKYIAGACEDRRIVREGKLTSEKKNVCVNGVVTWTPGDVNVAKNKGGLVSIVSTKEYRSQMPSTIIGIRKWNAANAATVSAMLGSALEGGDQVRAYPAALRRAAEASAEVYKEEKPEYWEKYYKGVTEPDKTGVMVSLGGSSANNLADDLELFGLAPGSANVFAATYTVFGDIVVQQYPKLVGSYPKVEDVLNLSYLQAFAASNTAPVASADKPTFAPGATITQVVSKRNWQINFDTGAATFSKDAQPQLAELKNGLLVADDLAIEIHGHTDNTGDSSGNMALSERRAMAVYSWLVQQSSSSFPASRFVGASGKPVFAHGDVQPVASNATAEGRAKNRRVVIVLGTTN